MIESTNETARICVSLLRPHVLSGADSDVQPVALDRLVQNTEITLKWTRRPGSQSGKGRGRPQTVGSMKLSKLS